MAEISTDNEFIRKKFKIRKITNVENLVVHDSKSDNSVIKEEALMPKINKKILPSEYQNDVYDFIKIQVIRMKNNEKPDNLIITAGAGCAKTTTLVTSLDYIPRELAVAFLAFNKDIVETLRNRVPSNVRVQTFHSAGFGALRYRFK